VNISIGAYLMHTESTHKLINGKPDWDKFKSQTIPKNISNTLMADIAIIYLQQTISKAADICTRTTVPNNMFNNNYKCNITPSIQQLIKIKNLIRKQW